MECDICFESFNRSEKLPKILRGCGHTFCESCVGKMYKGKRENIHCPHCRTVQMVTEEDYPVNNFALLVAIEEIADERQGKGISRYYKPRYRVSKELTQDENPTPRQILEFARRASEPFYLRMTSIEGDGEVLYQETTQSHIQQIIKEQSAAAYTRKISQLSASKEPQADQATLVTKWRYSYHQRSIFGRYLGMGLVTSAALFPFTKHQACQHTFGCFEHLVRKTLKALSMVFFVHGLAKLMDVDINGQVVQRVQTSNEALANVDLRRLTLACLGLQGALIGLYGLYKTKDCWARRLHQNE